MNAKGALFLALFATFFAGCERDDAAPKSDADLDASPPWDVAAPPVPRPGMLWIEPGVLIAGTPLGRIPRVPDEEMAGEQVVMRGYYIDEYPYPNEVGAISTTSLSRKEAEELCEKQNKRLCTELEHERACKGPENTTYEYGDVYKASVCATGTTRTLVPSGLNAGCRSAFGVADLHGGPAEWTASDWGRDGKKPGMAVIRGGNGVQGELVGRCANARAARPDARREDIGFRCCAGEVNTFEVVIDVERGEPFVHLSLDPKLAQALAALVPEAVSAGTKGPGRQPFRVEHLWSWRPTGNESLVIGAGCAKGPDKRCGVLVGRPKSDGASALAFVPTDKWPPMIGKTETARELFVYGGDDIGAFRKRVSYDWGRITIGEKARKVRRKGVDSYE